MEILDYWDFVKKCQIHVLYNEFGVLGVFEDICFFIRKIFIGKRFPISYKLIGDEEVRQK